MASTMLTAEASAAALTEADVDKAGIHSCVNDPDFAIICDFLQKFSKDLGLDLPNFKLLLQWLTKTDDLSPQLRDMQIKLLRKTRKTVHEKSWESALSKFCFTYSAQDGWEIERFGYKNSSVKVKLRILRELLECQFERNTKFRAKILTLSAESLRSKPVGRDRQGHAYWITQDNDCNIRIYQEHLDEDIWRVVATTREEFVNLIKRLRGSEIVEPCKDICIVDEDTNSSSHVDSESMERVPPPEERDDSQEEEQRVPKLSIKLVHEKSLKEATNKKNLDKIKKELVAEKGVKLLNSLNYSRTVNNNEGKLGDDLESEEGSLDDSSDEISFTKKSDTEQKSQRNLKSEKGNKKVKPLLISQNKVLNNRNSSTSRNASKKRALDEVGFCSATHSDQTINALKKSRTSLLGSKYEEKKKEGANYEEPAEETVELEELEEEDIDSAAAEEDENEEKLFSDYEDEDDDVGEEISDPIMHVTGEGSGKDCDVENYLYCIDYDLDNYVQPILSDIIVEDCYYVHGEGNGRDCLVGNNKKDGNSLSTTLEISKSNIEKELIAQSEISSSEKDRNISSLLENTGFLKLSTLDESAAKDDSLNLTDSKFKKIDENEASKEVTEIEKEDIPKEEINQPNGEKIFKIITLKTETLDDKLSDTDNTSENLPAIDIRKPKDLAVAEVTSNEGNQTGIDNRDNSTSVADVLTQQTLASKMSALESLKKELRESKQKLLEKKLPHAIETSNIKLANQTIYNRKRRLTNQLQTAAVRSLNSESEVDLNSENNEDIVNDRSLDIDATEEDVGGKRLKMRPKQANTELRKKIEAQKGVINDETTSSSGGEEELRKRKKYISKPPLSPPLLKPEEKLVNLEARRDCDVKGDEHIKEIVEKTTSEALTQVSSPLKKTTPITPSKVKPTLAEIIEKKLKKAPENDQTGLNSTSNNNDVVQAATEEKLHVSPKQISKPLKKSLTTQIKLEETDDDSVSRKLTNSQELNSVVLSEEKTNEKQKITPERQRKRRSSEETVQHDSHEEPEAKKEVTVIKENITLKQVIHTVSTKEETVRPKPLDFNIQKELSTPVSSRRSVRRSGVVPNYVDTLQSKRNRVSTKSSTKEFTGCENGGSVNVEEKHDLKKDVVDKSKGANLPVKKATPSPTKNVMREVKSNKITNSKDVITKNDAPKTKVNSASKTTVKSIRKQREVDTLNIIDIDSETPVRQSRRIAQQKIREEAERRKLEEIALRTMKQELKKKKKAEKQTDLTVVPPTEPSSESEESDVEIKKKVQKKKCPGKNGNWSSGSEEQEEPEEEDEEPIHYETDPGSPLFKSDHEFSPESDIEDESQVVPMKRARTVRKEDSVEGGTAPDEEEEACQKCNKSDHPEWILLCDNCDKGYHCSCLSPVLFYIPEGDWYCPPCQQEQLIKALESQLKEFDELVENKRQQEEQEKRMIEEEKAHLEREREINEQKGKKSKRIDVKRNNEFSSAEDHSQEDDEDESITSSDESIAKSSKRDSGQVKNRERLRNAKKVNKRNHRVGRHNITRSGRNRSQKLESNSGSESEDSSKSDSNSKSDSSSTTYSKSDNEPIYKLRKRRQINVSYRLNEYDDLIDSALKKEMDEAAGAGNLGRGKDISTIIEADKEEKARQKQIEEIVVKTSNKNNERVKETNQDSLEYELSEIENDEKQEAMKQKEDKNDTESIVRKLNIKPSQKKKSRKLTTLDISSEGDDWSDEDFKGSSLDDEEEEDSSISCSNSDSSLEIYKRHGKVKKKRRKAARRAYRERRRDRRFLVDESDDEDVQLPKSKKKRKDDSDYTESEADDDDVSELSENIDSADLCDDTTTDESDGAWRPNKRKKAKKSTASYVQKASKPKSTHTKKSKKVEYSDDDVTESEDDDDYDDEVGSGKGMGKQPRSQPIKTSCSVAKAKGKGKEKPPAKTKKNNSSEVESSQSDSEDSTRRTRGRRYAYIEDFEDDSSDGGIKPGVQRPDTPPEEREKFIKRQEEIKRMLAEKNAEGAKLVATPRLTPIKTDGENDKKSPKAGGDSLSTVPLSVIRQAKVLDIDYLQRRGENLEDLSNEVGEVDDDFDDADLPDDLPEDMDEDAIARMVEEEEEFGVPSTKELPAPDEVLRTQTLIKAAKNREVEKPVSPSSSPMNSQQVTSAILPPQSSGLQEPTRKRLPMPTMHPPLLRHQQFLMQDSIPGTQHLIQRHGPQATSHLLQNALSAPLTQPLGKNYPSTTPAPQHSSINRLTHNIPLQPTVSHALSATKPSQPTPPSIGIKTSPLLDHLTQDKPTNQQATAENKPRGRRKKITPLRDTLQKQQTAAAVTAATATSSALASSLVQNNEPVCTSSFLSSVIKSGTTPKLPIQTSVITSMTQTSNSGTIRSGVPMPPYVRTDGNRISQSTHQRHRESPQMPPTLIPPHPENRSSYGPPPPLKGSTSASSVPSSANTPGSIRNPLRHVPPPYLGMPPNARHASHLNMYRPPMYVNPNFGPRVNIRPPNIHPPGYSTGSRAYPPYGYYPPPPPLNTPGQRSGLGSVPRPSTHLSQVQATLAHPLASVIVSANSAKSSNAPTVTPQPIPLTAETSEPSPRSKSDIITQESPIKIVPQTSSSPIPVIMQTRKESNITFNATEPRKKLMTLQAYTSSTSKKSPVLPASDSSGSQSPSNPSAEINDDTSAPVTSQNTLTDEPKIQEAHTSEFSGLVSYFSSQHDDYNT